jgi:hypothetical protein
VAKAAPEGAAFVSPSSSGQISPGQIARLAGNILTPVKPEASIAAYESEKAELLSTV